MIILVTGASSGFGESIARKFIQNNHTVIGTGRRTERLKALHQELGDKFYPLTLDVQDRKAIQSAIANLPTHLKNIDVLVNNAGLAL
ncbi:SDR family NAD(P)-dependent oxidoreductase, partial [Escherichia coli]|nr:SDR family NAD(P)-dependent oxidoreductase [Escherichia coli]